jgi:hypothetical protein
MENNTGFIKMLKSEETQYLQENYPNAFLLLSLIARRARRSNGFLDGLESGMCYVGDYKKAGIDTEKKYRTAKNILEKLQIIRVVETRRNRKNTATKMSGHGTLVQLIDSSLFDINVDELGDLKGQYRAINGRIEGHKQEGKEGKERKKTIDIAQTNAISSLTPSHFSVPDLNIFFCFQSSSFKNISQQDLNDWATAYNAANISQELAKMTQWCLSNSSKANHKKLWRKFITTWLQKAHNEEVRNQAYRQSRGVSSSQAAVLIQAKEYNQCLRLVASEIAIENDTMILEGRIKILEDSRWVQRSLSCITQEEMSEYRNSLDIAIDLFLKKKAELIRWKENQAERSKRLKAVME